MKSFYLAAAAFLACGACHGEQTREKIDRLVAEQESATAAPAAKPFRIEEKGDLLDFTYAWPAEAAAVSQLAARFRKEMEQLKAQSLDDARVSKTNESKLGFEFRRHLHSGVYELAGQSARLLSLKFEFNADTGGAHRNHGSSGLLWDRIAKRELKFSDLFADAARRDALLRQRWCAGLDKERETKRGAPVGKGGLFDDCPKFDEIAIIPTDKDGDGRFERLSLIADPYVAGPWVEGDYEIDLPVTEPFVAALKPEFRAGFEVQPQ